MNVNKTTVYGDFLSSYVYDSNLLLQLTDNKLVSISLKDIESEPSIEFESYAVNHQINYMKLDQFITDFDAYKNNIIFCNSSGVFQFKINEMHAKEVVSPNKLWDAPVQCVRFGNNGRFAMSLAREGLYESDLGKTNLSGCDKSVPDNYFFQVTKSHSTSCCWSNGNLWNNSNQGPCSLFTYSKLENYKDQYVCTGEYKQEDFFGDDKEKSYIYLSETKKLVNRLLEKEIKTVRYSQGFNKSADDDKETRENRVSIASNCTSRNFCNHIKIGDVSGVSELVFNDEENPLIVYEAKDGLTIIDYDGNIVQQIEDKSIASWRVFPKSKIHRNELHVVFDDRLEIIRFVVS